MSDYDITYAQNREDVILRAFFPELKKGFYVDVGANHPYIDSVTKIFYDQGWRGINIEPNEKHFKLLERDRPEDINLQIGISDKPGKLTLREYPDGDGLSTFSKDMQKDYIDNPNLVTKSYSDYEVAVQTLKTVFEKHKVDTINFIKIDVEGYEYEVLDSNDWNKYRPQVICIESNHLVKDWRPLVKKHGYSLVFFDGLNDYYVADECKDVKEGFSYVNNLLLGKPILQARFHERHKVIEMQNKQLRQKLVREDQHTQHLIAEIHNLYTQQAQERRIRVLIKRLGLAINEAILTQINKLDKPRVKKQRAIHIDSSGTLANDLVRIKQYDLNRYYDTKNTKPLGYRVISGVYGWVFRVLKYSLRKIARILRGAKHAE